MKRSVIVILHDIRSAYNVGSIFRTADGAGVEKLFLSGHTPDPLDRFGRERGDIHKVALGAEQSVPWEHTNAITATIAKLHEERFTIVAVEQAQRAVDYRAYAREHQDQPICLIFGNEVEGISNDILELCDATVEIPMYGKKESLNVSVSAGVILFHFC